jgi:hypothetical protein
MLELRPDCDYCDKDLPAASTKARNFTYERTFCAAWVGSAVSPGQMSTRGWSLKKSQTWVAKKYRLGTKFVWSMSGSR